MPAHDRSHAASEAMADTVADDDDLKGGVLVFERLRHAAPESMGLADRVLWVIAKVSTAPHQPIPKHRARLMKMRKARINGTASADSP